MHPRDVLLGSQAGAIVLPVCDHYSGTPERMQKSLALQAELIQEFGACVMDVTLDCEDGAPAGAEVEHANQVLALVESARSAINFVANQTVQRRIAVRIHAVDHSAFASDVQILIGQAAQRWCHVMIPKVESMQDVQRAVQAIDAAGGAHLPLHALIESSRAVHNAFEIAAHPRVQSLSFGLMDFVSSHGGAIPADAMSSQGQFAYPLVLRAKLEIAAACHAHGKVPSHCVVTEFKNPHALQQAATRAARELGYTRMWSIHPDQVRPILQAFAPPAVDIQIATQIIAASAAVSWAPISFEGKLHDRASYRYHWEVLERAHQTGRLRKSDLAAEIQQYF
jgi:citrate lyase subunit beta / citryl-CoA lyase